jgi:hypothetical protein
MFKRSSLLPMATWKESIACIGALSNKFFFTTNLKTIIPWPYKISTESILVGLNSR